MTAPAHPPRSSCEFLSKLDLTVNFIPMHHFEESLDHLRPLLHLKELFLMGNPCTEWAGCRAYVAATLPQLQQLDGSEITRSERILAQQAWRGLRLELRALAAAAAAAAGLPPPPPPPRDDDDDTEPWSAEGRVRMYREMAEQKAEAEARKRVNEPRARDAESEHAAAVAAARGAEGAGGVRQTNEGRWEFSLEDEDGEGACVLRLALPRFLDTSLIDADVHPSFVSVVVRNKTFRILWPEEVESSRSSCQRSATTGELCVRAPKARQPSEHLKELRRREKAASGGGGTGGGAGGGGGAREGRWADATRGSKAAAAARAEGRVRRLEGGGGKGASLAEELQRAAAAGGGGGGGGAGSAGGAGSKAVSIRGLVKGGELAPSEAPLLSEVSSLRVGGMAAAAAAAAPPPPPPDDSGVPDLEDVPSRR